MAYRLPNGAEFRIDYDGLGEIMRSPEMQGMMAEAANALAAELAGSGYTTWVDTYTTDRGAAAVTVLDRNAVGEEVKFGVFSEAARAIGLEVKGA